MNERRTGRLDSWKEIADYVGRDVRTAIRWEHERGLPVHRVPGGKRGSVFAFTDEIDRWLNGLPGQGKAAGAADGVDGAPLGSKRGRPEAPRRLPRILALGRGRPGLTGGGIALLAVAAVFLGVRSFDRGALAQPASAAFEGRKLVAFDADGRRLWSDDLGAPLSEEAGVATRHTRVADVDGDGSAEVLAAVPLSSATSRVPSDLRCYSADGRLRWKARLEDQIRFRSGQFGPPWKGDTGNLAGSAIEVYRVGGQAHTAWVQNHHTWWPSVLSVFAADGRPVARFVHAGVINTISTFERDGEPFLLAGGVSNSREAAFVAVLDGRDPSGSGPEDAGSLFECLECPPGRPLRYFTVAPSEMGAAAGHPYNTIVRFVGLPDGFEVWTTELGKDMSLSGVLRFSLDLTLQHASWDSVYDLRHRELEKAGRLDHSLADCPERGRPPRVREWTPEGGWRAVTQPPVAVASAHAAAAPSGSTRGQGSFQ